MSYKIEDGIPLPVLKGPRRAGLQDCLLSMEVSQSVFVDGWKRTSMNSFLSKLGSHNSKKFIARPEGEGIRVWRAA